MELWTQARPLPLIRRSLRRRARHYDGERIAIECWLGILITSLHVCNQNPLGPTRPGFGSRARLPLGRDRVDCLASGVSATAWTSLVHDRRLPDLSATRLLDLVVQVRCLRSEYLHPRWVHRRKRRHRGHWRCHHDVGSARERSPARYDVRVSALGRHKRGASCGPSGDRWRRAWPSGRPLPAA